MWWSIAEVTSDQVVGDPVPAAQAVGASLVAQVYGDVAMAPETKVVYDGVSVAGLTVSGVVAVVVLVVAAVSVGVVVVTVAVLGGTDLTAVKFPRSPT